MITTVTLNTAIDKAYQIEGELRTGTVMRVSQCRNTAGGKGLNVARVVALCGEDVMATGLTGGYNGAYLEALLKKDGISSHFIHVRGETRCCINILDEHHSSTEFLEPGPVVEAEEMDQFRQKFAELVETSQVITMSGSVPTGVGKGIYAEMSVMAREKRKTVILDTGGELLREGIKGHPTMIKPNREELEGLLGERIVTVDQVREAAHRLRDRGIERVVVSLEAEGAILSCSEGDYLGIPPRIQAVNTVGCGDSMVAAFAVAYGRKASPEESLRYAVAVSAANAADTGTGRFDRGVLERICPETVVRRM